MKIKRLLYIACATLISFSSCSDFLDQDLPLDLEEGKIYSDSARIERTLLGIYGSIKNFSTTDYDYALLGGKGLAVFDARGEDLTNVSSNLVELVETYNLQVTSVSAENDMFFASAYISINRVNIFIDRIQGSFNAGVITEATYKQYVAEASFVRALCYYYLNNLYGKPYSIDPQAKSIPLSLEPVVGGDGVHQSLATVAQVYDQVLKDLSEANIKALPSASSVSSYAAVTRATKDAAYVALQRVHMAMGKFGDAITAGEKITGHGLEGTLASIFAKQHSSLDNKECIFSLPMASNNIPQTQMSLYEYYGTGKVLTLNKTSGIMSEANYSLANDERISLLTSGILLKKFPNNSKEDWVPIFRYAEVLLNLAECYAEKNTVADDITARSLLKQVRSRSIKTGDPLAIDALSGNLLKEAIYKEKRLEMIGEGVRSLDITRRGEDFVKKDIKVTTLPGYLVVKPTDDGYTWPLPEGETLINQALKNK